MVKVFTPNKHGMIEFTKEELESLLNEVWQDGYSCNNRYWWTSPTWTASDKTQPYRPEITCDGAITHHGKPPEVVYANGGIYTDKTKEVTQTTTTAHGGD